MTDDIEAAVKRISAHFLMYDGAAQSLQLADDFRILTTALREIAANRKPPTDEIEALVDKVKLFAEMEGFLGRREAEACLITAADALASLSTRVKEMEEALRSLMGESDAGMMFSERVRKAEALIQKDKA